MKQDKVPPFHEPCRYAYLRSPDSLDFLSAIPDNRQQLSETGNYSASPKMPLTAQIALRFIRVQGENAQCTGVQEHFRHRNRVNLRVR